MGGIEPPHWLVKYAKSHVFGGFEPDFLWKIENSPPHRKTAPPERFGFPILAEKSVSISEKTFFFFFGDHLILGVKNIWISDFGRKISINFGEDLFFFIFILETPWFRAEKTFEIPSFPRNFVSIFGQTVWNWFKNNEKSGQGRLHNFQSFKIAPPPLFQILATRLTVFDRWVTVWFEIRKVLFVLSSGKIKNCNYPFIY